jgi:thiol-disulfide isomerase/thioredoxin
MAGTLLSTRRRALAVLAAATACAVTARGVPAAPAAPIEWPELDWISGAELSRAELDGVPAIVVFWATYCAYCKRHNAHVDRLYRAVDPRRLHVLSVAVDSDAAGVRQYMAANGFRFPVALDAGSLRTRFTDRRVVPLTCTVGGDGRPGLCIPGEMTEADVIGLARLAGPGAR